MRLFRAFLCASLFLFAITTKTGAHAAELARIVRYVDIPVESALGKQELWRAMHDQVDAVVFLLVGESKAIASFGDELEAFHRSHLILRKISVVITEFNSIEEKCEHLSKGLGS